MRLHHFRNTHAARGHKVGAEGQTTNAVIGPPRKASLCFASDARSSSYLASRSCLVSLDWHTRTSPRPAKEAERCRQEFSPCRSSPRRRRGLEP
jgi:hypothetical protein